MRRYNFNKYSAVVPKSSDDDDVWVSYFERIVDDMYADGLKSVEIVFNLQAYIFYMPNINMRLSINMSTKISQYIYSFKFTECILEEEETFIV